MAVDGASLLAAAIRAACQAGAPRRTVQAVASAVTAILVRPAAAVPRRESRTPAGAPGDAAGEADDAPALLASLRAVRQAQRARKKERRRAAKVAAATAPSTNPADAAGRGPSSGEAQALALALAFAISPSAPSSGARLREFPPAWPGAAGLAQPAASSGSVEVDGSFSSAPTSEASGRTFSRAPMSEASGRTFSRAPTSETSSQLISLHREVLGDLVKAESVCRASMTFDLLFLHTLEAAMEGWLCRCLLVIAVV